MMRAIGEVLIAALVVGGALFILNLIQIDATIKKIVTVLVLIIAAIWAIQRLMGMA